MNNQCVNKFLAALIAATPSVLFANGLRLASQDGFATARGEAFVATADNPSAVYYNPAGITQIEGTQTRAGLYALYYDPTFTPPDTAPNAGTTYHVKKQVAAAPNLFATYAWPDSPVTLGLGIYAPYGGNLEWPEDTGFRSVAISANLTYLRFNPVVALKLPARFSLAAGVNLDYSELEIEQGLRAFPDGDYFRFTGDGWSAGYNLGLLWQPHEMISIGATFRSATRFNMKGKTEMEQPPVISYTKSKAQAGFEFPLTAVVGISFRPTPKWNIEFNADYTDWSSFDFTTIEHKETPPFPVQTIIPVTLNWKASWMYEFGVTRYFDNHWHVSAGYVFNQNSVPDAYYSPLAADLDRHFFTVGVGRKWQRFDFDVAYQFGYGPDHTVVGSTPASQPGLFAGQTADGTYDFISHAVFLSLGIRF
jgi:long-chain fatty acid transport protein